MRHEQTITIPKDKVKEIQNFLDGPGQGTCNVEYSFTADFGDGIEVDINVCDTEKCSTPYVDPVLFENGYESMCLEVIDKLVGEYVFPFDGNDYVVIVKEI